MSTPCYDWSVVSRVQQHLSRILIQALSVRQGFCRKPGMQGWINAQHEFAGIGLIGFFTGIGAMLQVIVNGFCERCADIQDAVAFIGDDVTDSGDAAKQADILFAVFHRADIAFVRHGVFHGFTF